MKGRIEVKEGVADGDVLVFVVFSIACLRRSIGLALLFFFLTITFMLLAIGTFSPPPSHLRPSASISLRIYADSPPSFPPSFLLLPLSPLSGTRYSLLAFARTHNTANFIGKESVTTAGGVFGCITAFIAYYDGMSELLTIEDAFMLPMGHQIAKRNVD